MKTIIEDADSIIVIYELFDDELEADQHELHVKHTSEGMVFDEVVDGEIVSSSWAEPLDILEGRCK